MLLDDILGNLVVTYTGTNLNVTKNQQFTVLATVTCVGGTCGNVKLALDPTQLPDTETPKSQLPDLTDPDYDSVVPVFNWYKYVR